MNKLSNSIVTFAAGNTKPYEQMRDYYFHYMDEKAGKKLGIYNREVSFAEKEAKMQETLLAEISRVAGQNIPEGMDYVHFAANPMIKWATFAVVDMMIDAILPETIIDSIGIYTDLRAVDFGDSASFDIKPRTLFTVSQSGNANRNAFIQKQFNTTKTLVAVPHKITVQVSLYKVLAGKESLAEFVRKAVIAIETAMTKDAYNALATAMAAATVPAALKVTGYSQDAALTLAETVTAYNQGAKAVLVGTTKALSKVLPDSAKGYRINTNSEAMSIQLIKNFYDYDIIAIPQVASDNGAYGLAIDDTKIYVISPSSEKLIKGVIEGNTLTRSNDFSDNANLTSNATIEKRWNFEFVSNAIAGVITLN